jgi:hypothetical protein
MRPQGFGLVPVGPPAGPIMSQVKPEIQYVQDFTIYEFDALAIAPAATVNGNIQIQSDSDFKLTKLSLMADIAAAAVTESGRIVPLCTLSILDTGSGRQIFSAPVALGALFGFGPLPFILPVPRIFKARTNIALALVNYSAATTYNIRMALIGSKIFQMGPPV